MLAALRKVLRFKLFQDSTYYVSTTGSDANDGLTPATAFATGQAAWNKAITVDLNGHNLTIQFANGTYTQPITCAGIPLGLGAGNSIILLGNIAQPNLVTFDITNACCVTASNGAIVSVKGVTLRASGVAGSYKDVGSALSAVGFGSVLGFNNVIFGVCGSAHVMTHNGAAGSGGLPYTISGSAPVHLAAIAGDITITNSAITLTGTPNFSDAFAFANAAGGIGANGNAFAGAATGARYDIRANSVCDTNGGGANYFPGNAVGIVSTGAQYI